MDIKDIKKGESYHHDFWPNNTLRVTAVGESWVLGRLVYKNGEADEKEYSPELIRPIPPKPKRYIVEHRIPKQGEQYVTEGGTVRTAGSGFRYVVAVIVEELP